MSHRLALLVLFFSFDCYLLRPVAAQDSIFRSYMDSGFKTMGSGDYPAAEKFFRLALKEADAFPSDDNRRDQAQRQLAMSLDRQFKYVEAEKLLRQSLARVEKSKDKNNVAHGLTLLANHYRNREKYDQAEPLYKQALAIRENANGPKAWETAQLMRDLADLHRDAGRADEAERSTSRRSPYWNPLRIASIT